MRGFLRRWKRRATELRDAGCDRAGDQEGRGDRRRKDGDGAHRFRGLRAAQGAADRGGAHRQQQPHRAGDPECFSNAASSARRGATSFCSSTWAWSRRTRRSWMRTSRRRRSRQARNEVEPLTHEQNDDIPADRKGARFITDRTATAAVSKWLAQNGWTVVTSELGYVPKNCPELTRRTARRRRRISAGTRRPRRRASRVGGDEVRAGRPRLGGSSLRRRGRDWSQIQDSFSDRRRCSHPSRSLPHGRAPA